MAPRPAIVVQGETVGVRFPLRSFGVGGANALMTAPTLSRSRSRTSATPPKATLAYIAASAEKGHKEIGPK